MIERWQPPDELRIPGPRSVKIRGKGIALVCLTVVFLIAGPVLSVFILRQVQQQRLRELHFAEQGVLATATVVRLWHYNDKSNTPMVSYRFSTGTDILLGQSSL